MPTKNFKTRVLTRRFVPFNAIVIKIDVVSRLGLVLRHVVIARIQRLVLLRIHFHS